MENDVTLLIQAQKNGSHPSLQYGKDIFYTLNQIPYSKLFL